MSTVYQTSNINLIPVDNRRLAVLCGQCDEHLRHIEQHLKIEIHNRGNTFFFKGPKHLVKIARQVITRLYDETQHTEELNPATIHLFVKEATTLEKTIEKKAIEELNPIAILTKQGAIKARSPTQLHYLHQIATHTINFGIGPAGTGKTFLAVACAVQALEKDCIKRILLVRPAVEAGERLGFLPGDLAQKVDPYLRPLYDALYDMLGPERVIKLVERNVIEIAPLAYMRGRTLSDAFIILDEAQNTTPEQMKMFLTRIGFGSTAVITGDITQIDLPRGQYSGLCHATEVLHKIPGISFTYFQASDVVRHPIVQRVVQAYDQYENRQT